MKHRLDPSILREYDIRGTVGQTLGEDDAHAIGQAFAARVRGAGGKCVAVGYDGRISSPMLEAALVAGLAGGGVDVVRIGLGPTPMLYFAEASMPEVHGGIEITGSHNPPDQNGFKFVLGGRPFFGADIAALANDRSHAAAKARRGTVSRVDVVDTYVGRLLEEFDGIEAGLLDGLSAAWDAGNGAAGPVIEALVARMPGRHILLHTHVDGTFPHHHPDPTIEANLADLRAAIARENVRFGFAFDGDGDRIGVVDAFGRPIWGDQLLMIFAQDLLARMPGATIIADIKASQHLFDRVRALGGVPDIWKTGHSLIKSRMKAIGAPLAGEMTGHMFFADRYYGFDDALYAALRLITATVRLEQPLEALRASLPVSVATPELRFPVDEARKFDVIGEVAARLRTAGTDAIAIDGLRVTTPDGWWLLRASNTEAALVARAESSDDAGLARLLDQLDTQLAVSGISRAEGVAH